MCIYIYIYIYIHIGKGQMGSALMGSLRMFRFLVLPLNPNSPECQGVPLFQSGNIRIITFAAAPLVLTPFVRNRQELSTNASSLLRRADGTMVSSQAVFIYILSLSLSHIIVSDSNNNNNNNNNIVQY